MKRPYIALVSTLAAALAACSDVQPVAPRALAVAGAANANNGQAKVDVCHHSEETNSYILISIAQAALPAHLAHGDGQPGGPVPGQPGMQFGPDCVPRFVGLDLTAAALGYVNHTQGPAADVFSVVVPPPPVIVVSKLTNPPQTIENRGIIEFHIVGIPGPVGHAELHLPVVGSPVGLFGLGVFSYSGDGVVGVSDFASGSLVSIYPLGMNPPPPNGTITIDVTAAINSLIAAHAAYAGFNLRVEDGLTGDGSITLSAGASALVPHPTLSIAP